MAEATAGSADARVLKEKGSRLLPVIDGKNISAIVISIAVAAILLGIGILFFRKRGKK